MRRLLLMLTTLAAAAGMAAVGVWSTRRAVEQRLAERAALAPSTSPSGLVAAERETPTLATLLSLATSSDTARAEAAQQRVERLLLQVRHGARRAAPQQGDSRLTRLAAELRRVVDQQGDDASSWYGSVARRVLRIAGEQQALTDTLMDDCNAVLAVTDRPGFARPQLATDRARPPRSTPLPSPEPKLTEPGDLVFRRPTEPRPIALPPAPLREVLAHTPDNAVASETQPLPQPPPSNWSPNWGSPDSPATDRPPAPGELIDALSDRELLRRYLPAALEAGRTPAPTASGPTTRPTGVNARVEQLRQAVTDRGYGRLATRHVEMLLSENAAQRQQLVAELIRTHRGESVRLLMLLATDESPEVRHDAIRALSGSNDPRILDAVWQMALEDRDPRVARIASEMQQRRR